MFKKAISQLLETEMDRKDFLKNVGIATVALTGAAAAVKMISPQFAAQKITSSNSKLARGYGSSPYGGYANSARTSYR